MLLLLLLQSASGLPDIELNATVSARSVTIEKQGTASLSVTSDPEGGNIVNVSAPKGNGRQILRNVDVKVRAEARIRSETAQSQKKLEQGETGSPKSR